MMVLFNFVIAILSSTYAFYEQTKLGLYYNVLNSQFSEMQWDEHYGGLVCVKPPLPSCLLLLPLVPFYACLSGTTLRKFNTFVCFLMFIPNSVIHLAIFIAINLLSIPPAYLSLTTHFLKRICHSHSGSGLFKSIANLLVYVTCAPVIYCLAVPIDTVTFFVNMYVSDFVFEEKEV